MQDVEAAHSQSLVSFLELQSARRGLRRERAAPEAAAASAAGPTEASATPPAARSADARTPAAPPSNLALRDNERAAVRRTVSGAPRKSALAAASRPRRNCACCITRCNFWTPSAASDACAAHVQLCNSAMQRRKQT
jgi:hypothetical protein